MFMSNIKISNVGGASGVQGPSHWVTGWAKSWGNGEDVTGPVVGVRTFQLSPPPMGISINGVGVAQCPSMWVLGSHQREGGGWVQLQSLWVTMGWVGNGTVTHRSGHATTTGGHRGPAHVRVRGHARPLETARGAHRLATGCQHAPWEEWGGGGGQSTTGTPPMRESLFRNVWFLLPDSVWQCNEGQ